MRKQKSFLHLKRSVRIPFIPLLEVPKTAKPHNPSISSLRGALQVVVEIKRA